MCKWQSSGKACRDRSSLSGRPPLYRSRAAVLVLGCRTDDWRGLRRKRRCICALLASGSEAYCRLQERDDPEEITMLPFMLHRMHHRAKAPATTVSRRSGQDMQMVIGSYEACFRGDSAICTFQTTQSTAPVSALFFCRTRSSVSRGLLAGWHGSLTTSMDDGVCQRHPRSRP